jgi:hypothetical protein
MTPPPGRRVEESGRVRGKLALTVAEFGDPPLIGGDDDHRSTMRRRVGDG